MSGITVLVVAVLSLVVRCSADAPRVSYYAIIGPDKDYDLVFVDTARSVRLSGLARKDETVDLMGEGPQSYVAANYGDGFDILNQGRIFFAQYDLSQFTPLGWLKMALVYRTQSGTYSIDLKSGDVTARPSNSAVTHIVSLDDRVIEVLSTHRGIELRSIPGQRGPVASWSVGRGEVRAIDRSNVGAIIEMARNATASTLWLRRTGLDRQKTVFGLNKPYSVSTMPRGREVVIAVQSGIKGNGLAASTEFTRLNLSSRKSSKLFRLRGQFNLVGCDHTGSWVIALNPMKSHGGSRLVAINLAGKRVTVLEPNVWDARVVPDH